MREIKFRGKVLDGKWIYGAYLPAMDDDSCDSIINSDYPSGRIVKTDSVGQYTGLKDKNGKEICEGDILLDESGTYAVVGYSMGAFYVDFGEGFDLQYFTECIHEICEVVGNIHDDPELLKTE